jgi:predicted kinase
MKTLYMCLGLPASGKSTYAKELVAFSEGRIKRTNKDLIREMADAGVWSRKNEKEVVEIRDLLIKRWLNNGHSVIVDDTGFGWETKIAAMAKEHGASFEILDFTDVPIETCLERDAKRANGVGADVIRRMHKKFLMKKEERVEPPPFVEGAPSAVLVDLDGSAALMDGRKPFDWGRVGEDLPNPPVIDLVNLLRTDGEYIIFVSGRDAVCRLQTRIWLKEHIGEWTQEAPLFMRPEKDNRKDTIVKREIYDNDIAGKFNVRLVLDDRSSVVEMWRSLGLPTFQVNPGDF